MGYLGTTRFIKLYCMFAHLLRFLGIEEVVVLIINNKFNPCSTFAFILNGSAEVHLIDF